MQTIIKPPETTLTTASHSECFIVRNFYRQLSDHLMKKQKAENRLFQLSWQTNIEISK